MFRSVAAGLAVAGHRDAILWESRTEPPMTRTAATTPATAAYIAVRECLGDWILEEYNSITAEYNEMPEYYPSWKECKRAIVEAIGDHLCYNDHPIFEVWDGLNWEEQYGILDDVLDFMLNAHAECADW